MWKNLEERFIELKTLYSSDKNFLDNKSLSINQFLDIAVKCCDSLQEIHSKNIIHKDIKPHNILINTDGTVIKITDFGISTFLNENLNQIYQKATLEGTLPYISPEQTGRVNISLDQRADLYSLGITFYELLTTERPFKSEDPLELIHAHIAKQASRPSKHNPKIPKILDAIILKLMSKPPQERYQSVSGLKEDLVYLRENIEKEGNSISFELGKKDFLNKFQVPEKLYGREKEIELLLSSFQKITEGYVEIASIEGVSGIGKSVLVNEVQKPILEKRGYFLTGKCEQFKRDVPYSVFIQAFQGLFTEFLAESDDEIQKKKEILSAIGGNAKVVTELFPLLELVVGEQPELEKLSPEANQNRFHLVFSKLLKALATKNRPIVLFLDDMQWIDLASLELLKYLYIKERINFLQLILSFRNNETPSSHPLMLALEKITESGITHVVIELKALEKKDIHEIIQDSVGYKSEKTEELRDLVYSKTQGNPFFVNQLLTELGNKKIIYLSSENVWDWDPGKVEKLEITDDVVKFMVEKITQLDKPVIETLRVAAAIGNRFSQKEVLEIINLEEEKLSDSLITANQHGLIFFRGDKYHFAHDRIQEAAYSLILESEKPAFHYRIAKKALEKASMEDIEKKIFFITDHFNQGKSEITDEDEKLKYIKLNLQAGMKAKSSSAFGSAYSYINNSFHEISGKRWEKDCDLCFNVSNEYLELLYLNSMYEDLEKIALELEPRIKKVEDLASLQLNVIKARTSQGLYLKAIDLAIEILDKLDLKLSKHPSRFEIIKSILSTKWRLSGGKLENVIHLPELKDNLRVLAINKVLNYAFTPAYFANPELFVILVVSMIHLSLKYGNTKYSSYAYATYGVVLCGELMEMDTGYKAGEIALKLNELYPLPELKVKIHLVHYNLLYIWTQKLSESIIPLEKVFPQSIEVGDYEFAGFQANTIIIQDFFGSINLKDVDVKLSKYNDVLKKSVQISSQTMINGLGQLIHNLLGKAKIREELSGEYMNYSEFLMNHEKQIDNVSSLYVYTYQSIVFFLFHKYEEAFSLNQYIEKYRNGGKSSPISYISILFQSLIIYSAWWAFEKIEQKELKRILTKNIKFFKTISKYAPMNFNNKYLLLLAEKAKIENKKEVAIEYYKKSIEEAKMNSFLFEQAIANEQLGKYYLNSNQNIKAKEFLTEAYNIYSDWGAIAKVEHMEREYHYYITKKKSKLAIDLTQTNTVSQTITQTISNTTTGSTSISSFDVSTILKTSQALSGEIELQNLLKKIMKYSIENAGAQRGVLLLPDEKGKSFKIEAEGNVNEEYNIMQSISIDKSSGILPISIINYVRKSKDSVILEDASNSHLFKNDPYIVVNNAKSIICVPLKFKRKISGIIYLENNLTTNTFSGSSLEIIKVLSSQAAISIENTRLLEQREKAAIAEKEMEIARDIQTSLLLEKPEIKSFDVLAYMQTADEVGGDYYDVIQDGEDEWVVIADVSGHGVPAGLVMMMIQTSLHTVIRSAKNLSIAEKLKQVNHVISENVKKMNINKYATFTLFHIKDNKFYFSGLHQDILIYRKNKKQVESIETRGSWLGYEELMNEFFMDELSLSSGDTMFLYTDGITEGYNAQDEMYGIERLRELLNRNGEGSLQEIQDKLLDELKDYPNNDDVTFMIIRKV